MYYGIIASMNMRRNRSRVGLVLLAAVVLLAACRSAGPTTTIAIPTNTMPVPPTETPTPPPPTPTPEPLAARVNGESITLAEFQAELTRYQNSGTNLATEMGVSEEQLVLDDMIGQLLLAQAAAQAGFVLDDAALQARIDQLAGKVDLAQWLQTGGYSGESFHVVLRRSIAAAWMRDQVTSAVPVTAEQTHAVQILLYNLDQANQVYTLLQSGQDFMNLAWRYDPVTGGELGWFPRGYLTEQAVEEAAFALQPGEYSPVVQTRIGNHIVYVLEREAQRQLDGDPRLVLQEQALKQWLDDQRAKSQVEIFIP